MEHALAKPPLPPLDGYVPAPRQKLDARDYAFRRAFADFIGTFEMCPNGNCRRAGSCRSRTAACFDRERQNVTDLIWEIFYEGYHRDTTDEDYYAAE